MGTKPLAHFIFFSLGSLPRFYNDCYSSFVKKHPSYKTILWTPPDIEYFLRLEDKLEEFYELKTFINKYNFVKYSILDKYGGWYVDLDIIWNRTLDELIADKFKKNNVTDVDLFIPVRSFPREKERDFKRNDDMLVYAKPGIFGELIEFAKNRTDVDYSRKYEPFGPISLSMWLDQCSYSRIYMFEDEIQDNGYYCHHANKQGWKFS
jgi:hypothetical protein